MSKEPTASVLKTGLGSITQAFTYQTARRTSCKVWGCNMCTLSLLSRYAHQRLTKGTPASDNNCLVLQRAGLQASSQELYGQPQPLLLEVSVLKSCTYVWLSGFRTASMDLCLEQAPARKVPSEGDNTDSGTGFPSATVQADQQQHTTHALEMLLPHEPATHFGAQATSTGTHLPSPQDLLAAAN